MIEYRVNKDKGTVCAFMTNCRQDFINYVYNATRIHRRGVCSSLADLVQSKWDKFPDRFVAVAKCNPTDKWNEELGKEVAKAKLLIRYYTSRSNFIRNIYTEMSQVIQESLNNLNFGFMVSMDRCSANANILEAINQGYDPTDPNSDFTQFFPDMEDDEDFNVVDEEYTSSKE
jgi:hypothetical protein